MALPRAASAAGGGEQNAAERVKLLKRSSGAGASPPAAAASPLPSPRPSPRPRVCKPDPRRVRPGSGTDEEVLVGRRVREPVTSTRFREGTVESRDALTGRYTVRYDDPALPPRTGLSGAAVRGIALPKNAPKQSRIIELPPHPICKSGGTSGGACRRSASPPPKAKSAKKAKAEAPSPPPPRSSAKRGSGSGAAATPAKASAKAPGSVEAFLRSIDPPLSQARPAFAMMDEHFGCAHVLTRYPPRSCPPA